MKTKTTNKQVIRRNAAFWITLLTSVALFIGGFFVPPMGIIDGSLLQAAGILLGFGSVGMLPEIIQAGKTVKINLPGDNSIEVGKTETETVSNN